MIEPPQFNAENGYIPDDFQLFITGPSGGDILYTLNGSDPGFSDESSGGTVIVYDGNPVPLVSDTVVIKARVKTDALWSRLVSKRYFIGTDPAGMNPGNPIVAAGKLRCYPNPAHGYINFSFTLTESSAICLSIYSLTGEKVIRIDKGILEKGTHVTGLNTGNIPPGNYFCFLESMNKPAMQRIMFTLE
jgi:hypothetical protein